MGNQETFRLGLLVEKKQAQGTLRTEVKAYLESLDFHFYRYPFELEKIDLSDVRNLTARLCATLEQYQQLDKEIKALEG